MTLKDMWELARTPLAAPETKDLRRMRIAWLLMCTTLAVSIAQLSLLRSVFGAKAPLIPLFLILVIPIYGWRYFRLKRIADDKWLYEDRP